ncbi:MAG: citrate transporter [Lachnospiraceae bacterium]|nr:citrate transporter [Robinsoniella sp.]MDY3766084.1 citrate transporter [Lachnospiraceae bacterium]
MQELVTLSSLHYLYLIGVLFVVAVMIAREDTPIICISFLFILGLVGTGSLIGGIQTVFQVILYAAKEFMEIIATIALVTALSKCLTDLGSDYLLMTPMSHIMKKPAITWWILGIVMFVFSLFLWPSPSVALVGAIMLPFALKAGLNPLAAAMAMNLFGHGFALSYDFIIQGAPSISASAAGISVGDLLKDGRPIFLVMGIVTVVSAFLLNRKKLTLSEKSLEAQEMHPEKPSHFSRAAIFLAILTPIAFLADIIVMIAFDLNGGGATSIVSGTALLLMCIGAFFGFKRQSFGKVTSYITEGFSFAIRIFAPVIIIGAFFFLGGNGISEIMGEQFQSGLLNDWAIWLAHNAPLNKYGAAVIQVIAGVLTGMDGSGFSGLPLTGSLAQTFGYAVEASIPVLAALGQVTTIFVGGGTIVPWGLIPAAAICNVNPVELARKNILPVCIGLLAAFLTACLLL